MDKLPGHTPQESMRPPITRICACPVPKSVRCIISQLRTYFPVPSTIDPDDHVEPKKGFQGGVKSDFPTTHAFEKGHTTPSTPNLVIGAGPAGLMRALRDVKSGNNVVVLEKRSEDEFDVRPGLLKLEPADKLAILEILSDYEFPEDYVFSHSEKTNISSVKSVRAIKEELNSCAKPLIQTKVIQRILLAH